MFRLLLALSLACCVISAVADRVDDLVKQEMKARQVQGAVLAVIRHGKVIKKAAYGYSNIELMTPMKLESVFEIGSVTKQFTATLMMKLVEEGKLKLDQPLSEVLPDIPVEWREITVRRILAHQSGFKNVNELPNYSIFDEIDYKKTIDKLKEAGLEFEPGTKYAYRNTGYVMAGYIIAHLTGKTYWQYLSDTIFKPLKMTSSQDRNPSAIIKNRVAGYDLEEAKLVNRGTHLTDINAAGAITSTILDLVKWNKAIDQHKIISKESQMQMWMPNSLKDGKATRYGMGWGIYDFRGVKLISHGGSTSGFSATIEKYVDNDLTIIMLTNIETLNTASEIGQKVAAEYIKFPK